MPNLSLSKPFAELSSEGKTARWYGVMAGGQEINVGAIIRDDDRDHYIAYLLVSESTYRQVGHYSDLGSAVKGLAVAYQDALAIWNARPWFHHEVPPERIPCEVCDA